MKVLFEMETGTTISILAIAISFTGCILVPFLTKWLNAAWDKEKSYNEFLFNLNSLKEKWLNYFRSAIDEFIEACTTICILKDSVNDNYSDEFHFEIGPYHAKVESKASRILLLFKKDAPELDDLIPLLAAMMEATKEGKIEIYVRLKWSLSSNPEIFYMRDGIIFRSKWKLML